MASGCGNDSGTKANHGKQKKKTRGPTTAKYIIAKDDGPFPLEWDEHKRAFGIFKERYVAYIGYMTRAKVKITINEWCEVDKDITERLWIAVKKMFMCADDKKEAVLRDCNKRWKEFKTRLTREYFTKETKNVDDDPPWEAYVGIEKEDWETFTRQRKSDTFLAISARNRDNQAKNEHPHHLGRGGYEKREDQYIKDQLKQSLLSGDSSLDVNSEMPTLTPRPRYLRWIDGRKDKTGHITNKKTQIIVDKIYELLEKEKTGEFKSVGSHDILTEALGNAEHGGHVRGIGGRTTITSIFKRKKRCRSDESAYKQVEEITHIITEHVKDQTRSQMKAVVLEVLKSCGIQVPNVAAADDDEAETKSPTPSPVRNGSSSPMVDPGLDTFAYFQSLINGSKDGLPCDLMTQDGNLGYRIVAKGTLCHSEPKQTVHGVPLLEDHVKVTILNVLDGEDNTPLPVPFFGHDTLGDQVEGSWAQWPQKQIKLAHKTPKQSHAMDKIETPHVKDRIEKYNEAKKAADHGSAARSRDNAMENEDFPRFLISQATYVSLPSSCKELYNLYKNQESDFTIDVEFEDDVYYYHKEECFTTFVGGDDIKQMLNMECLSVSCVHIWIRFLQNHCKIHEVQNKVGYFCPQRLAMVMRRSTLVTQYLNHAMTEQSTKHFILAPFYQDSHWMLIVVCLQRGEALFFDSAGGGLDGVHVKGVLSMVYRSCIAKNKGCRKSLSWTKVNCAILQGAFESGYYVMKYMYQIVSHGLQDASNLQKLFSQHPYSQEEIDDVREKWSRYFITKSI